MDTETNIPSNPVLILQKILDAQAASNNPGRFRLEKTGEMFHVIPTMIKNKEGLLVQQESVLDTVLSIPAEERTVLQKLEVFCEVLSKKSGVPILLGAVPENWLNQRMDRNGAVTQRARDILAQTLTSSEPGTNLSWQLFYSATMKRYYLHFNFVSVLAK